MKVFILVLFVTLISGCKSDRKGEIHLLPEGYTGGLVIVYQDLNAPPLPLIDGYYIYNIPDSGILYTSTSINDGSILTSKLQFYHKQSNGGLIKINGPLTRSELSMEKVKNAIKENELYVFSEYTGASGRYAYSSYMISKSNETEEIWLHMQNLISKLHKKSNHD
ncbi:MAG: hypothetical protein AAF620_14910 [Bacteroidota bacterium]